MIEAISEQKSSLMMWISFLYFASINSLIKLVLCYTRYFGKYSIHRDSNIRDEMGGYIGLFKFIWVFRCFLLNNIYYDYTIPILHVVYKDILNMSGSKVVDDKTG